MEIVKTKGLSVAELFLGDFLKEENLRTEVVNAAAHGRMGVGDALRFLKRFADAQHLKSGAQRYRENTIIALAKSRLSLKSEDVRKISASDCVDWASTFGKNYAPSFLTTRSACHDKFFRSQFNLRIATEIWPSKLRKQRFARRFLN